MLKFKNINLWIISLFLMGIFYVYQNGLTNVSTPGFVAILTAFGLWESKK